MNLTYSFHSANFSNGEKIYQKKEWAPMNDREKIRLTEMVSGAG